MGYHIILKHDSDSIEYHYVETINELANYQLKSDSIVYQGEKHWIPEMLKNSKQYGNFAYDWHRVGIKAQELFKKQALEKGYIIEELSNDKDSFRNYTGISDKYIEIKRGDFLIRNVNNIEVEVKCRNFYKNRSNGLYYFNFRVDHLKRHKNMSDLTKCPIIIAVYERKEGTDEPIENSLHMIEVSHMLDIVKKLDLKSFEQENRKGEKYYVYRIPVKNTAKGFTIIEKHK